MFSDGTFYIVVSIVLMTAYNVFLGLTCIPPPVIAMTTNAWIPIQLGYVIAQVWCCISSMPSHPLLSHKRQILRLYVVYVASLTVLHTFAIAVPVFSPYGATNLPRAEEYFFIHLPASVPAYSLLVMTLYRLSS